MFEWTFTKDTNEGRKKSWPHQWGITSFRDVWEYACNFIGRELEDFSSGCLFPTEQTSLPLSRVLRSVTLRPVTWTLPSRWTSTVSLLYYVRRSLGEPASVTEPISHLNGRRTDDERNVERKVNLCDNRRLRFSRTAPVTSFVGEGRKH